MSSVSAEQVLRDRGGGEAVRRGARARPAERAAANGQSVADAADDADDTAPAGGRLPGERLRFYLLF